MSIYTCPHCGEKSFNPIQKAFAGQLNSKGKPCSKCGRLCVNGKAATAFNAIFCLAAFAGVIVTYLKQPYYEVFIVVGLLFAMWFVPKIVNAFFFKLAQAIRIDVK